VNETDTSRSSYRERPAPPRLAHALRLRWEQRVAPGRRYRQRVLPDGHADLIVDDQGGVTVVGPATRVALPELAPGSQLHGLRLAFDTVGPLLRVPADELTDRVVPAASVLPNRLVDALVAAVGGEHRAEAELHRWLVGVEPDLRVRAAVQELWLCPGVEVGMIADRVGLSSRQLRRALLTEVGLAPKTFQRVGRLQRFLRLAAAQSGRGLAELAIAAGYADQPHLSREVRALSGLTPSALRAAQLG
jgi:AraC-like DNA-binding protein